MNPSQRHPPPAPPARRHLHGQARTDHNPASPQQQPAAQPPPPALPRPARAHVVGILCQPAVFVTQRAGAGAPPTTTPPRRDACGCPIVVARPAPQLQAPPARPLPPPGQPRARTLSRRVHGFVAASGVGGGWARRVGAAFPPPRSPRRVCFGRYAHTCRPTPDGLPAPFFPSAADPPSCVCCAGVSPTRTRCGGGWRRVWHAGLRGRVSCWHLRPRAARGGCDFHVGGWAGCGRVSEAVERRRRRRWRWWRRRRLRWGCYSGGGWARPDGCRTRRGAARLAGRAATAAAAVGEL